MRIKNIDDLLEKSPDVPGYGGGQWAMYSVHCCWWTSFPEDLGNTADFMPGKLTLFNRDSSETQTDFDGLPCCPRCGSVLMQAPLEKFIHAAQENPEHYGHFGIDAFLEAHHRNSTKCHQSWLDYNDEIWRRLHPETPPTYS
jgi:hypothetical protein